MRENGGGDTSWTDAYQRAPLARPAALVFANRRGVLMTSVTVVMIVVVVVRVVVTYCSPSAKVTISVAAGGEVVRAVLTSTAFESVAGAQRV